MDVKAQSSQPHWVFLRNCSDSPGGGTPPPGLSEQLRSCVCTVKQTLQSNQARTSSKSHFLSRPFEVSGQTAQGGGTLPPAF